MKSDPNLMTQMGYSRKNPIRGVEDMEFSYRGGKERACT